MRRTLSEQDKRVMTVCVLVLATLLILEQILYGIDFLLSLTADMLVMTTVVSAISQNIRTLSSQIRIAQSEGIDLTSTPLFIKTVMYRSFQFVLFSYICAKIVLEMGSPLLDGQYPWIRIFAAEIIEFTMCFCVGFIFRLRSPNIYNSFLINGSPSASLLSAGLQGRFLRPTAHRDAVHPMPVQSVPLCSELGGRLPPGLVLIENPPSQDASGKLVRSISVATISLPQTPSAAEEPRSHDIQPLTPDVLVPLTRSRTGTPVNQGTPRRLQSPRLPHSLQSPSDVDSNRSSVTSACQHGEDGQGERDREAPAADAIAGGAAIFAAAVTEAGATPHRHGPLHEFNSLGEAASPQASENSNQTRSASAMHPGSRSRRVREQVGQHEQTEQQTIRNRRNASNRDFSVGGAPWDGRGVDLSTAPNPGAQDPSALMPRSPLIGGESMVETVDSTIWEDEGESSSSSHRRYLLEGHRQQLLSPPSVPGSVKNTPQGRKRDGQI
ncbi:hypothetical protein CBR_g12063 [Chara braunii]|uniref:Uncharacterized protein n=1 Tax=Chara braunii TaxID=69332 RepID=A0A388KQZ3_CHABU|nr:hypothetical protein CBR_g12063 [Chara braunii]|eukprot:GBG72490.1 hypothetical protein CBR_g12063 [Chara braunii]